MIMNENLLISDEEKKYLIKVLSARYRNTKTDITEMPTIQHLFDKLGYKAELWFSCL